MENFKKIELHVHLDGSVRPSTISELSGLKLNFIMENMIANKDINSLSDYLKKFDLPLKYMQSVDNLKRIAKELVEDLKKDNVIYAEVRFAPNKHKRAGLDLDTIVLSVLSGLLDSELKTKLILCMMRGDTDSENIKIVELAKKYNLPLDLAGDEKNYPNENYENLFAIIRENNLDFTIHSGEALGKESIIKALDFNAKRIGHGINIENDRELINRIKREHVLLEICPTSNLDTKVIETIKKHPAYRYYKEGIDIIVNTDNRTVSNTDLNKEYELLLNNFNFSVDDFKKMNYMTVKHTFLNENEKIDLLRKLEF